MTSAALPNNRFIQSRRETNDSSDQGDNDLHEASSSFRGSTWLFKTNKMVRVARGWHLGREAPCFEEGCWAPWRRLLRGRPLLGNCTHTVSALGLDHPAHLLRTAKSHRSGQELGEDKCTHANPHIQTRGHWQVAYSDTQVTRVSDFRGGDCFGHNLWNNWGLL